MLEPLEVVVENRVLPVEHFQQETDPDPLQELLPSSCHLILQTVQKSFYKIYLCNFGENHFAASNHCVHRRFVIIDFVVNEPFCSS